MIEYRGWDNTLAKWEMKNIEREKVQGSEEFYNDEDGLKENVNAEHKKYTLSKKPTFSEALLGEGEKPKDPKPETAYGEKSEPENMKLTANLYTISYCAFMRANKEKYKLKANDQIDIFYRAMFMFIMQMSFIAALL